MFALIKRTWVAVVVVLAVALGAAGVIQLRARFGSDEIFAASDHRPGTIVAVNTKQVTYELFGPAAGAGKISYLNAEAKPEEAVFTGLPWTHTFSTTAPAVVANLIAQGDTDTLGCRITVNGAVKDEQQASGASAQTFCLVKAA